MSRAEVDLQISVRKACSSDEVPPKRKHVRACIVYTWDHKNSRAFWNAVKIQPLQNSEVQLFKALIMIHKVLQEGHPNTLKDGYRNKDFLYSLSTVFPSTSSYGLLINQYDRFLLQKLEFHRGNHGFNGVFEYEEYISLRTVNDPNEGYESILQLMDLQDLINDLQKHIFSTVHQSPNNLCKVSALVPLISESYGIYKFLVSMLRAMFQQLGDDDALGALLDRFSSQHFVLRDFYTDCQSIKFLTSLVTIPRIAASVPNMKASESSQSSAILKENQVELESEQSAQMSDNFYDNEVSSQMNILTSQKTEAFNQQQQLQQQQLQLQQNELEAQRQQQLQDQIRRQQLFEEQTREHEQQKIEKQQFLRQQQTQMNHLRVSELEQDLLMFKAQFDNDQALLQQYDSRVKSIEMELLNINDTAAQQIASKDEQITIANEQITSWSKKYESLAKLYSQLRLEHLSLLAKFKKIQQKISSAQESILKKEKFERELKAKNLELADLIRERDRARLDVDRVKASKDLKIEHLQIQIRELKSQANDLSAARNILASAQLSKYEEQIQKLKSDLIDRDDQLASLGNIGSLRENLKEKEIDLEITQQSLDSALKELSLVKSSENSDHLIHILDVILANSVKRIHDSEYELLSPMQAGNSSATPEYLLSFLDLCSDTATNFAQAFNDVIADGQVREEGPAFSQLIIASSELTSALNDLTLNLKGLTKTISPEKSDELIDKTTSVLSGAESLFLHLASDSINEFSSIEGKIDFVIDCNLLFQHLLQTVSLFIDTLCRTQNSEFIQNDNIEDVVEGRFNQTAEIVEKASSFLRKLMSNIDKENNMEIHGSILEAALAVTKAVSILIASATESQIEIVCRNKGEISKRDFYKKNNRWTEGLVSASKAVAGATNVLIQTANGILKNENIHEQLIVACNEVAAATAQLVAASRVKANFISDTQENLEVSSKTVNSACKYLVAEVQKLIRTDQPDIDRTNYSELTPYEGKTLEMEQQVQILKLENSLLSARQKLAEIRKHGYADDYAVEAI